MRNYEDGKTYVDHLLREHRRLHQMLLRARQAIARCGELSAGEWAEKIVRMLQELRNELRSHFAEEEEGGCLAEAVSFQPSLSPELKRAEADHPHLLDEVDRLIAQARDCCESLPDRVALELAFDELCRDIHAHEAAENEILRRGFGADIDANGNGAKSLATES